MIYSPFHLFYTNPERNHMHTLSYFMCFFNHPMHIPVQCAILIEPLKDSFSYIIRKLAGEDCYEA